MLVSYKRAEKFKIATSIHEVAVEMSYSAAD